MDKPPFENGNNGSWLIAVVGTQSVSILIGLLVFEFSLPHLVLVFFSLCMFLLGCMLYILIITLIFYRFMFFQFKPADLSHSYWINMGAVAITTLAGTLLIGNAPGYFFLNSLLPFISGFTIFSGPPPPGGFPFSWCSGFGVSSFTGIKSLRPSILECRFSPRNVHDLRF